MPELKWTAWGCFGLAGFAILVAMSEEAPIYAAAGVSVGLIGMGFWGADRAVQLLAEIRDRLPKAAVPAHDAASPEESSEA